MITLNDYLYDGNTVLKILIQYATDLKAEALRSHNTIDLAHSNFQSFLNTMISSLHSHRGSRDTICI